MLIIPYLPRPLPQVAMQLLDYHYADEKVRSLAVKRLSKLTNDELLVYFLQLIQVNNNSGRGHNDMGVTIWAFIQSR